MIIKKSQNNRLQLRAYSLELKTSVFFFLLFFFSIIMMKVYAQNKLEDSIIVNGDIVEYSMDEAKVTASGNVKVIYKGSVLSCDKISVNTKTKDAIAEGNVRLDDKKGVIEGEKINYNFESKTGTVINSQFRANPYFGRADVVEKVSENEFIAIKGYASTCSFDDPHYRFKAKKINVFPEDKLRLRGVSLRAGEIPLFYLPGYNHSLKDPIMHVRMMPGKRKDWGPFMLSAWRYNLSDNLNGRIYLDYRNDLGVAEGFGLNYASSPVGKGDFKFYYTQERPRNTTQSEPGEFQRYLVSLRHKWDIDQQTKLTSEIYKIHDEKRKTLNTRSSLLKDYFYREYEVDSEPLSYVFLNRHFRYSSFDLLVQKRINHWFDQLDKLPEAKYSLPSIRIAQTPFYFENASSFANLDKKAVTSPVTLDEEDVVRFDTTNKFSLPAKISIFRVSPFISSRQTAYDKGVDGSALPVRTVFYSGTDLSTKFYRIYNFKTDFLSLDIDDLRHIITPTIAYSYNHEPTIGSSKLKQIDTVDSITRSNKVDLELSNKLQSKRNGQSFDLVEAIVSSSYLFKPKSGDKLGSNLSDLLFDFKILPYSWLRIETDATYERSGNRSEANYNHFSNINYDINFDFSSQRSFGIGQRYLRKAGNEIIYSLNWRFNPKWKFSMYHRHQLKKVPTLSQGLKEQEYVISRDLHCWDVDLVYNVTRGEGESVWVVFRLKAFPETKFELNQSYHKPKSGSQSIP